NLAWRNATGDLIAFIDDDEFPVRDWLRKLLEALSEFNVAGVLGPVVPHFDYEPPRWVKCGRFFDRPAHHTGYSIPARESRTGNVLINKGIVPAAEEPFREEFGSGGEVVDFFRRLAEKGHEFVRCSEAVTFEEVPPSRCRRGYLLKRALLRGAISVKN